MKKEFNLKILSTSDIHGTILAKNYADNSLTCSGLSVVSSMVKKERTQNTILLDVGDDLQGNPLMYFHQLNRDKYKNPLVDVFNYLKYDYFIPGNHDFNYGLDYLQDFTGDLNALTLCANILDSNDSLLFKNAYDIIEYPDGPKVLIVGVTTQYIPNWENPSYIKDIKFINAFESAKQLVDRFRSEVDLVVVAYHGGFENDLHTREKFVEDTGENLGSLMLKEISGIDVLISAHQHRHLSEKVNDTLVIQSGSKADSLGVCDIEFIYKDKWVVSKRENKLLTSTGNPVDEKVVELVKDIEADCQSFLDQKIGNVVSDNLKIDNMFNARVNKHPIVTFINKVQLFYTKAMISGTSLPNDVTGFEKNITIRNVLSTYVYANTLAVLEVNGDILKQILEKNAEYFICAEGKIAVNPRFVYPKVQHYNYDMFDGIDYLIDIDKDFGDRIVEMKYQNKLIKADDIFTLTVNNYRASGGGDFAEYKKLKVIRVLPFDITELIIDYIVKNRNLIIKDEKNIKIISENC